MLAQMVKKSTYPALRNNPRIDREFGEKTYGKFPAPGSRKAVAKREKLPWFPGIKNGMMAAQETPCHGTQRLCRRRFLLI
ncbi:hypothetical protein [Methylomonas albis]|uniref:Uncharacterized protein n=1 Tax=Methylomonas albis TaxID=1854563 RepID=A0ABR9D069_9GAMM|nr:hypothetical protein [Methylomonas albis]MBD9356488.1 hypothetical protein [Methylomonas albis]